MNDISRRKFIGGMGAAGVGVAAAACTPLTPTPPPAPAAVQEPPPRQDDSVVLNPPSTGGGTGSNPYTDPVRSNTTKTLVYVSLFGGNDGLNTLVPYTDPTYKAARGALALDQAQGVIPIGESMGLHPALGALKSKVWDEGKLAVIRGVGYPNPDRSHFRSTDIWHTGQPDTQSPTGWGGLWLDSYGDALGAVAMTSQLPRFLRGSSSTAICVGGNSIAMDVPPGQKSSFEQETSADAQDPYWAAAWRKSGADLFRADAALTPVLKSNYPTGSQLANLNTRIARDLGSVLKMIANPSVPAKVYYVTLYNFDTHTNQLSAHAALLQQLGDALGAFHQDLKLVAGGENVTTLISSEFGRRLGANASGGTDHGSASTAFVMGAKVNGGFHGSALDLTTLDPVGDPYAKIDFRSVVTTLLARQLGVDPQPVLGGSFPQINFLAA